MSKLNVDQKTIFNLLSDKKSDFLIPDYQRPYAWDEEQCQTLWDDIFSFSFPNNNSDEFDENEEYFLGSIVTFKNEDGKLEVIDGQQRLTTLMLILRAFYDKFANMNDPNSISTREMISKCLWKTDTFGNPDKNTLKINSEVATDNDKQEFLELLKSGQLLQKSSSQYVTNFNFFQSKIDEFLSAFPSYFPYLPARILGNCILLPIEAESQDTALRIFSTLNDRGLPLSDADIFKAQFYKYYGDKNQKDWFIQEWKGLEDITSQIFNPSTGTPMDELFARYMYFLRAEEGIKKTTTEALRKFYERGKYKYLKNDQTIPDLKSLAIFWEKVTTQDSQSFSNENLKKLFVLKYAPNGMWQYFTSVYFLTYKNDHEELDQEKFGLFLDRITAFIYAYAILQPGVNALRTPIYDEMLNIVAKKEVTFSKYKFNLARARSFFENYRFVNQRPITRSMVTWYAFTHNDQKLLDRDLTFELEHIYSKKRQEMEQTLSDNNLLESLGNKILLEERINIRASDYRFEDKKKIYSGEARRGKYQEKSKISEIQDIINLDKFDEEEIVNRNNRILDSFFEFLNHEELIES